MDVSNPDRVVFSKTGATKRDVVDHYERAGPLMMRFVAGSPLTLQRFPKGLDGPGFMQKNTPKHYPETVQRLPIPRSDGSETIYPVIQEPELLPYFANQGTITFHVWTARLPDLYTPDFLVIDLDPEEGDAGSARTLANATRDVLRGFGVASFPLATGSKGYHVWAPLVPAAGFEDVSRAARAIAGIIAADLPDLATTEFLKKKRQGRVFVDWLRNRPVASVVAPWSLRPRPGAPVATPLYWEELDSTSPDQWTIDTIAAKLADPPVMPEPSQLDVAAFERAAAERGIDLDVEFDRFGRRLEP